MALDSGTTSNRCIIFDKDGNICEMAQKEFKQYYPKPGWVEHNAEDIWSGQLSVAVEAMAKMGLTASDIAAIGITNQRETTIVWDKNTSQPIYRAIVWQCRRTAGYCDELKRKGLGEKIRQKTGLMPDAYFSAAKIRWILDNVEGAAQKAADGNLMFGTVAAAGVRIVASQKLDRKAVLIIAASLSLGIGVELMPDILRQLPESIRTIFSSGITTGGLTAIITNAVLNRK